MSTIVTRAGKGSPLTHNEVDANFNNLNNDKYQSGSSPSFAGTTLSSGNLTFSSTAQRITGDMSNATLSNRLAFQTSTTNGNTTISALPNGTAVGAACRLHNSSDPANSSRVAMGVDSSITYLESAINGTGSYLPMTFYTGGSERVRIDTTGRVGIGLTNPTVSLQVANTSGNVVVFSNTTAGERLHFYTRNAASTSRVESQNSDLEVYTFDANALKLGTSNTERMRIDTSGNVGIGRAPNYQLDVYRSGTTNTTIAAANDNIVNILQVSGNTAGVVGTITSHPLIFTAGNTERMRIDSSGNVGIGKTPTAGRLLDVNGDAWFNGVRVGLGVGANQYNTVVGVGALNANTTGSQNTAVGYTALANTTTGIHNTGIGTNALGTVTTGSSNTAVGNQSLQLSTTAQGNSALGGYALYANTTGGLNTATGYAASMGQTTANYNSAHGAYSLHYCTTGSANTASGYYSLLSCTTGGNNTAMGYYAGYGITTGTANVLLGQQAGYQSAGLTTGVGNICLGAYSDVAASANNYEIVIGYNTQGKGSSTGFINPNGGGVYQGNNSSSWSTTSDRRLKKNIVDNNDGLAKINQLRVRNFEYRTEDEVDPELPKSAAIKAPGVQLGVIAQEIQKVLPECVKQESTGVLSVDSDRLIWHLVNAVKELSAEVNALKAKLGE